MRTPPTCQAVRKWCVLAFPMVRLPIRLTRRRLGSVSTLGGWTPEALKSEEAGGSNMKIAFGDLEDQLVVARAPLTCRWSAHDLWVL